MDCRFLLAAIAAASLAGSGARAADAHAGHHPPPTIAAAVADEARPAGDVELDAVRKPAEMLAFAGVKPGQTVVDLLPGGGYFTRLFSKAVGPAGAVYAVGGPPRPSQDPSKPPPPAAADLIAADPGYANVKSLHMPLTAIAIPAQADIVWTAQNYHDIKNLPNVDMVAFNKDIFDALKPGGVYVVLDHVADPKTENPTRTVHRIDPAVVKQEVEAAGFKFVAESRAVRNPADDHSKMVTDPSIRHRTDQFVYKFKKPK